MLVSVEVITPVELLYDAFPLADILPLTCAVVNWVLVSVLVSTELILIVLAASSNTTVVFVPSIHCPAAKSLISSSERWVLVSVLVSVEDISPLVILTLVPAVNLPLTSAVDNWVFVSVELISPSDPRVTLVPPENKPIT